MAHIKKLFTDKPNKHKTQKRIQRLVATSGLLVGSTLAASVVGIVASGAKAFASSYSGTIYATSSNGVIAIDPNTGTVTPIQAPSEFNNPQFSTIASDANVAASLIYGTNQIAICQITATAFTGCSTISVPISSGEYVFSISLNPAGTELAVQAGNIPEGGSGPNDLWILATSGAVLHHWGGTQQWSVGQYQFPIFTNGGNQVVITDVAPDPVTNNFGGLSTPEIWNTSNNTFTPLRGPLGSNNPYPNIRDEGFSATQGSPANGNMVGSERYAGGNNGSGGYSTPGVVTDPSGNITFSATSLAPFSGYGPAGLGAPSSHVFFSPSGNHIVTSKQTTSGETLYISAPDGSGLVDLGNFGSSNYGNLLGWSANMAVPVAPGGNGSSCQKTLPSGTVVGGAATPDGKGYYIVDSTGDVAVFGNGTCYGSMSGTSLNKPIVGMAVDPATGGYWLVASDGGIFSFNAPFLGSTGNIHLNKPIVGMEATSDGQGYRFVASDGGVFDFGDAQFYGSTGNIHLNQPVVGMASDPATGGYWLVASDGGVFSFNAPFLGSTGNIHLNQPVVGMNAMPDGQGYRFVASDGGIFDFGDAQFYGSTGNIHLNKPVVGFMSGPGGQGYWNVASDGGVFSFNAPFYGSAA